ncbi:MAG TPA: hypothetical protein VM709_13520, partial [Candidatus Sulfotelmatobacter sp.]|nr:hypothetical protein [Candidatus Sulfotelmatobacter sp.]
MRMSDVDRGHRRDGDGVMAWTPEAERFGFATGIARRFAEAWLACGVFEWIALGYLGLSSVLIALFAENL